MEFVSTIEHVKHFEWYQLKIVLAQRVGGLVEGCSMTHLACLLGFHSPLGLIIQSCYHGAVEIKGNNEDNNQSFLYFVNFKLIPAIYRVDSKSKICRALKLLRFIQVPIPS